MRQMVIKRDIALGEGTRKAGDVLCFLPEGVDPREISAAVANRDCYRMEQAVCEPEDLRTPRPLVDGDQAAFADELRRSIVADVIAALTADEPPAPEMPAETPAPEAQASAKDSKKK